MEKTKEWFDKKWLALAVSFGVDFIGLFAIHIENFLLHTLVCLMGIARKVKAE